MSAGAGAEQHPPGMDPATAYLDTLIAGHVGQKGCARCGSDHERLDWKRFAIPVDVTETEQFIGWATCPTSGDPILLWVQSPAIEGPDPGVSA